MVSVLASSAVDRGFDLFKPRSGQTKDYAIGICCFSATHEALIRKKKDWLAFTLGLVCTISTYYINTDASLSYYINTDVSLSYYINTDVT
jgi:hypothetical protein